MKLTKNNRSIILLLIASATFFATSCSNDDGPSKPSYSVPATYNFSNAKYTGQQVRLRLLDTLGRVINSAKTQKINKADLLAIYDNTLSLYGGTQKLSDKTAPGTHEQVLAWFDLVDQHSPMSNPGTKDWFFTPDGQDISQLVQKTLMGSVFYYQATSTYLDGIETDDNTTVREGNYTDMEHFWDEAFGYYGAPVDFNEYTAEDILKKFKDTNGNGKQDIPSEKYYYYASYSLQRDEASKNFAEADRTNFRKNLMENFIKGRAAISNKDFKTRDNAKKEILKDWEKLVASNAIHYFNEVKKRLQANSTAQDDIFALQHEWAEGRGFLNSLKYNNNKIISSSVWDEVSALIGENPSGATIEKLSQANEKLKQAYGFTDYQRDNL